MVRNRFGDLYTGITTNLERRYKEHEASGKKTAKCLKGKGPLQLVFQQLVGNRSQALKAEAAMKKAVRLVVAEHKRSGRPLVVWKDGKVNKIAARQIV